MRAPGPPLRFLLGVGLLWIGGRVAVLRWPDAVAEDAAPVRAMAQATVRPAAPAAMARVRASAPLPTEYRLERLAQAVQLPPARASAPKSVVLAAARPARTAGNQLAGRDDTPAGAAGRDRVMLAAAPPPQFPGEPAPATMAPASADRRWSGSAFLFARGGGGAVPLAGGGQLGASQAGARIAYRIDEAGHVAAAARIYAPINSVRGSEAAVGVHLHPLPGAPLRLSVERRIALGRAGRDAWSAYAAGGFFRGIGRAVEVDGYAQAGIVGTAARDLFADGAVRAVRRFDLGGNRAVLAGGGVWAAAQPGVERVDAGPRVALRLPAGAAAISIAGEWRARLAGSARPRSGPALTLAADF